MKDSESTKAPEGKRELRDYTSDLPMFDLSTAIEFVGVIHERALETASMLEVAKGLGYSNASSTPFYRKVLAARIFGLLAMQAPELTNRALDYLKPDAEDAKSKALNDAIMGIPAYSELVQSHQGKRLNLDIVANGFMRKFPLTKAGASLCARVFVSSIRTAGFMAQDGTISAIMQTAGSNGEIADLPAVVVPQPNKSENQPVAALPGTHTHILPLANQRKVTINAPLDITPNEISRLKAWAEVTLLVEWHEKDANQVQ